MPTRFFLLVYRMPARPTAGRVAVWRLLRKVGGVYLQQSVCVFPDLPALHRDLAPVLERILEGGGEYHLLPLRRLPEDEQTKLVDAFRAQSAKHYEEIIEDCEVKFQKEIEFENFRENFTYEEAEEIRAEFEKIVLWFERVRQRDWFEVPEKGRAEEWLGRCQRLLEEFEARVYTEQEEGDARPAPRPRRRNQSG
ncbi:MAG TPA: Chromate resistance protein ChrB [Candidatus Dormibacteraeota bacterium]|jgi:hypothetical protein|nr:Chromate resistance protein ChrB [Candidatus Dormibacteraeota bacterium]